MKPKTEKTKKAPAEASLKELLGQQLDLVDMLDQVIDELGLQYGVLVEIQEEIAKKLHRQSVMPEWVSESWRKEVFRGRLAAELAEHSSGGGNESIFGPAKSQETLLSIFRKIASPENLAKGGAA